MDNGANPRGRMLSGRVPSGDPARSTHHDRAGHPIVEPAPHRVGRGREQEERRPARRDPRHDPDLTEASRLVHGDLEEITNMAWTYDGDRAALGRELAKKYDVKARTSCYTCHR